MQPVDGGARAGDGPADAASPAAEPPIDGEQHAGIPQVAVVGAAGHPAVPLGSPATNVTPVLPDDVDLDLLLIIGAGGAIGAVARYGLAHAFAPLGSGFPLATYLTNVSGSFALGLLTAVADRVWPHTRVPRLFLGVGVLGGFTTFSTYAVEIVRLIAARAATVALVYAIGSVVAGVLAAFVGLVIGERLISTGADSRQPPPTGHTAATGSVDAEQVTPAPTTLAQVTPEQITPEQVAPEQVAPESDPGVDAVGPDRLSGG